MHGISDYTIQLRDVREQPLTPAGKRYDAELHFTSGFLSGLKLTGFSVWQHPHGRLAVRFPGHVTPIAGQGTNPIRWAVATDMLQNAILRAVALAELSEPEPVALLDTGMAV